MINQKMIALGNVRSAIREVFEYGNRRAEEIGRENIFDFSLGNPSVPPPSSLTEALQKAIREEDSVSLHGYTSAPGAKETREAIADYLRRKYRIEADKNDLYMTCGAAASLTISLTALVDPDAGDEVIVFAPFFPEYRVFTEQAGAKPVVVPPSLPDFGIDLEAFRRAITPHTKAVILNTPCNPTGTVLSEETIRAICGILAACSQPIWLISDEPYRELVHEGREIPYMTAFYDRTLVCYSYSKSLSIPGERIGFIFVNPAMPERKEVYSAICGAGRSLGYVCAPSLWQKVLPSLMGQTVDVSEYRRNAALLYEKLTSLGFRCVKPKGAFYLFMEAPGGDANAFCTRAKEYELLLVPSDSFGCTGYVRIAYCVSEEMIRRSFPAFEKLAKDVFSK